jgi:hypothetical protein
LELARRLIKEFGPGEKKRELSRIEKTLYEWALKFSAKQFMPPTNARAIIKDYDEELAQKRLLAEQGRAARAAKKAGLSDAGVTVGGTNNGNEKGGGADVCE